MRHILSILAFFICLNSIGQIPTQTIGNANNMVKVNGRLKVDSGLVMPYKGVTTNVLSGNAYYDTLKNMIFIRKDGAYTVPYGNPNPRVFTSSGATLNIDIDSYDNFVSTYGAGVTINIPTGTALNGRVISIILLNGTTIIGTPLSPSFQYTSVDAIGTTRTYYFRYESDSNSWIQTNPPSASSPTLQQVTNVGNRTTTNVLSNGVNTSYIKGDTLNQNDYEFIVYPDIQGMTRQFPYMLDSMVNWTIRNKNALNIKSIITVGDLTDYATVAEFDTLNVRVNKIDTANIPFLPVLGNHDYDAGEITSARPTTRWNSYLGVAKLGSKPWFGAGMNNKTDNYYLKFDVGSRKYLLMGLEFLPTDSALTWAGNVVDSFPDRIVIISTHAHVTTFGERAVDTSRYTNNTYGITTNDNNPEEVWQKLLRKKKNIKLVLSGHYIDPNNQNIGYSKRVTDVGDNGNIVNQIFVNYQRDGNGSISSSSGNVGLGYLMRMRFSPSNAKVYVSYYSPYLQQYDTRIDSFNVDEPELQVTSSMGVAGHINALKDAKVQGNLFVKSISKNAIPYSTFDGRLRDTTGFHYTGNTLYSYNINSANTAEVNGISYLKGNVMVNNGTSTPIASFDVLGRGVIRHNSTTGLPALNNGLTSRFYVIHGGGEWGLSITRASNDGAAANLSFYKTRSTDASVPVNLLANDDIGRVSWQTPNNTGAVKIGASIRAQVNATVTDAVPTDIVFHTTNDVNDANLTINERMRIKSIGNIGIGTQSPSASAILELSSTIRGFLPPRMTTAQGSAISSPATGLEWYDTDRGHKVYYDGSTVTYSAKITIGTSAPAITPTSVGQIFVDTVNKKAYISTGTSSSADWTILN